MCLSDCSGLHLVPPDQNNFQKGMVIMMMKKKNKLERFLQSAMAALVLLTAVFSGTQALAADSTVANDPPYTIKVDKNVAYFLQNGEVTGTYALKPADLSLSTDRQGEVLVSFVTTKGTSYAVTLGKQATVTVTGTVNSLTASSGLTANTALVVDAQGSVKNLNLYAPITATVQGTVETLTQKGASTVTVEAAGKVTTAILTNKQASLKADGTVTTVEKVTDATADGKGLGKVTGLSAESAAQAAKGTTPTTPTISVSRAREKSGLMVDNSDSRTDTSSKNATVVTSGRIRLQAKTIDATYGDTLDELQSDLEDAVKAYNNSTGKRLDGEVSWVSDGDTKVRDTEYYRFDFEADSSGYSTARGRIKISVDDDDDKKTVYLEFDPIYVSKASDMTLRDLQSELESAVTAYARRGGDTVDGTLRWSSSSRRVNSTDYYSFTFTPDSSRYKKTTDKIKINVQ